MNTFQHDWDLLKATQDTLREHMQRLRELEAENEKYSAGMQENCQLRKRISELEAELEMVKAEGIVARAEAKMLFDEVKRLDPHRPVGR